MSGSDQNGRLYLRTIIQGFFMLLGAAMGFALSRQIPTPLIWALLAVTALDAMASAAVLVLRALSVREQKKTQALIEYLGSEKWAREIADAVVAQKVAEMAAAGQSQRVERQGGWA